MSHLYTAHKKNICRIEVEIVFLNSFIKKIIHVFVKSSEDQKKMDDIYSHSTSKFFLTRSSHHKFIIMVNAVVPLHVFIYKPKTHGWILSWVSILGDLWLRSSRPAWAWVEWPARYPDYTVWPGFPPLRVGSEHELAFAVQLRSEVLTPLFRVVNSPKEKGKMLTKNCFLYRYIMYIMYYSLEDI